MHPAHGRCAPLRGDRGCGGRHVRVNYSVVDRPVEEETAEPQYRVANEAGATLVSIYAGQKPTGGYAVEISGVDRQGHTCIVRYRIDAPASDAIVTQALTYPGASVRISPACPDVKVDPPLAGGQAR